jgi:uncharacterized membrane protein
VVVAILLEALRIVLPWSLYAIVSLLELGFFALWIFLMIQTYQGKKIALPVIGDLAAKQA